MPYNSVNMCLYIMCIYFGLYMPCVLIYAVCLYVCVCVCMYRPDAQLQSPSALI